MPPLRVAEFNMSSGEPRDLRPQLTVSSAASSPSRPSTRPARGRGKTRTPRCCRTTVGDVEKVKLPGSTGRVAQKERTGAVGPVFGAWLPSHRTWVLSIAITRSRAFSQAGWNWRADG